MTINKDNVTVHLDIQSHQTIQWPIAFSVFVEHGFVVSKGHTSIKKTVDNKSDLNITYKQNPPKIILISISTIIIAYVLDAM